MRPDLRSSVSPREPGLVFLAVGSSIETARERPLSPTRICPLPVAQSISMRSWCSGQVPRVSSSQPGMSSAKTRKVRQQSTQYTLSHAGQ